MREVVAGVFEIGMGFVNAHVAVFGRGRAMTGRAVDRFRDLVGR